MAKIYKKNLHLRADFFQTPPNGRFYESELFLIRKFQSVVLLFVFHLEGEAE